MKFEVYQGKKGLFYWRLKAKNGRIIADGAEGYANRQNARRAVLQLKRGFADHWHAQEIIPIVSVGARKRAA